MRGNYYRKNFILILLIACIPGLVTGICIDWLAVGKVEDELMRLHRTQIEQRAKNLDDQFEYLELTLSHWAFEPRFGYALKSVDFLRDFKTTHDLTRTLVVLQGSHPLIRRTELFLDVEQPLLFTPQYNVLQEESRIAFYQSLTADPKNVYWKEIADVTEQEHPSLALVHHIPGAVKDSFGAIVVYVNMEKAVELLKTLTPYNRGATFLFNRDDSILMASSDVQDAAFVRVLQEELEQRRANEGNFLFTWNGIDYSISYGKMERIQAEWTYVSAAPLTSVTSPVIFTSKLIMMLSLTGLILAFFMSWFASSRIHRPVARLVHSLLGDEADQWQEKRDEFQIIEQQWNDLTRRSRLLQSKLSKQLPQLKEGFLLQLIRGYLYNYTEEDLRKRMENYGWTVEERRFIVMDVQLTGFDSDGCFSNNDEELVTFAAANIMEELAARRFQQFNILNFHDLSVNMLLVYPRDETIRQQLKDFAKEVTESVNDMLQMQVTVTISEPADRVKQISHLFQEVRKAKSFRNFENRNQIIDLKEIKPSAETEGIYYPFALEKEIIQAIRMGQTDQAERLLIQFMRELKEKGVKEINIQPGMIQLFSRIQHEILHSGIHPYELFKGKDMFAELAQIREPERMIRWVVEDVIVPFVRELENRMNMQRKKLVEAVIQQIHEQYMHDISLESCADEAGVTPYTLSKAFKQIAGDNFIDYLTQLRIDRAKELLLHTDMKISDIAAKVGYRHSYFNRIFKKQIGLTPNQFRKANREQTQVKNQKLP